MPDAETAYRFRREMYDMMGVTLPTRPSNNILFWLRYDGSGRSFGNTQELIAVANAYNLSHTYAQAVPFLPVVVSVSLGAGAALAREPRMQPARSDTERLSHCLVTCLQVCFPSPCDPRSVLTDWEFPAGFKQQLELFRDHGVFVSPHGAGLVNSLFLVPRSSVIEVFPAQFDHTLYPQMASLCSLGYSPIYNFDAHNVWATSKVSRAALRQHLRVWCAA